MDAKCLHSGRNKWNSVNHLVIVMRNDVLQKLFRSIFEMFWLIILTHLKFQETRKVAIFKPPNSYILHWHSKKCSFYYLFERKWHEKFQIWKILNFTHVHFGTTRQIFNYGLQEELMGAKCLHSGRNKWN